MTIKKLKSIDIINVLSDLVSEKMETTVKLPEYVNGSTFEKKENPDGTVSIVLNNIQDITIK